MRPSICISCGAADAAAAETLRLEMTRYGFYCEVIEPDTARQVRDGQMANAVCLVALTSRAAETGAVGGDIRSFLQEGRPVLCVSLEENALDGRYCAERDGGAERIEAPVGNTTDRVQRAYYLHQLYLNRLCRLPSVFTGSLCEQDDYGKLIRQAWLAYRVCEGKRFVGRAEQTEATRAVWELAEAYREGHIVPRMESEAAVWLERGARLGLVEPMLLLAEWKKQGRHVTKDPGEALTLFRRVAERGDARGYYQIGLCALDGSGMMRDTAAAIEALTQAAKRGYAPAYYRLGLLRREGVGAPPDRYAGARDLYIACRELTDETQENGEIGGGRILHTRPRRAEGRRRRWVSMRKLREDRLAWLLPGLSEEKLHGCMAKCTYRRLSPTDSERPFGTGTGEGYDPALAAYELGRTLELDAYSLHALYWYRRAAERGHAGALLRLAECYRVGRGVLPSMKEAVKLYRMAAKRGDAEAQFRLGVCYEQGICMAPDPVGAVHWYAEAAKQDYAPAQNNLGGCMERGTGTRRDEAGAVDQYRRAALSGLPEAVCRLGLCYERGRGILQDEARALGLYTQAAEAGHPYATYRLGLCYDRGRATQTQFSRAAQAYAKAAGAGVPEAAYAMGLCCQDGRGVSRDTTQAFSWFAASAAGCAQGALEAGLCLLEGQGAIRKPIEAKRYFEQAVTVTGVAVPACKPGHESWPDIFPPEPVGGEALYRLCEAFPEIEDVPVPDMPPAAGTEAQAAGEALYRLAQGSLSGLWQTDDPIAQLAEAARLGNADASLLLGDLYASGQLTRDGWEAADAAVLWYTYALTCPPYRRDIRSRVGSPARMRLAEDCFERAQTADPSAAEAWNTRGWRYLTGAADCGSGEAVIRLAECAFRGLGTRPRPGMAKALLDGVRRRHGERFDAAVCLWLGDFSLYDPTWLATEASAREPQEPDQGRRLCAAELYRLAAHATLPTTSELIRNGRPVTDTYSTARAEAMYRLALLGFTGSESLSAVPEEAPLVWLSRAILAGHPAARRDLARVLAYRQERREAARHQLEKTRAEPGGKRRRGKEAKQREMLLQALREQVETLRRRSPNDWLKEYYTALAPVPMPFRYTDDTLDIATAAVEEGRQDGLCPTVTPRMDAECMNHLGEWLFRGEHLPPDRASAVACYRQAARLPQGRGEPVCMDSVNAQYSLGWCLVRGVGCTADPREGVQWLTRAAKYNGEAAYMLAECCERGIGVDVADSRAAVTYYKRALRLGCRSAASAVAAMERALRKG